MRTVTTQSPAAPHIAATPTANGRTESVIWLLMNVPSAAPAAIHTAPVIDDAVPAM